MKLRRIDDLLRPDHWWLEEQHDCYFLREYTSTLGFAASETNSLIINFKMDPCQRGNPYRWRYKTKAIATFIKEFSDALDDLGGAQEHLRECTMTWIPPHIKKGAEGYDDRLEQLVEGVASWAGTSALELIAQRNSTEAAHHSEAKRNPKRIMRNYHFAESAPREVVDVVVFDDVLTTGAHFVAFSNKVLSRWPKAKILGFFVARRVFPEADSEDS